jgi:hypothetical protein
MIKTRLERLAAADKSAATVKRSEMRTREPDESIPLMCFAVKVLSP